MTRGPETTAPELLAIPPAEPAAHLALGRMRARLSELGGRLVALGRPLVAASRARLGLLASQIDALSPLAVLGRGYAIALHEATGRALVRATDAAPGDAVLLRLHDGRLHTRVERRGS